MPSVADPATLLTPADDGFHPGDHPWLTEGSWWSFHLPEEGIGCWIYHQTRFNLGLASGGIWLWDRSASLCFELPYYNNRQLQALSDGPHDLNDFTWPDGTRLRTLESLRRYRLTYDDPGRLTFDLEYTALMEPAVSLGGDPPRPHRLDQACTVVGRLVLEGREIAVECLGFRDHSWEVRPESPAAPRGQVRPPVATLRKRPVVYLFGTASAEQAFFLIAPGEQPMASSHVTHEGLRAAIVRVRQDVCRNADDGHIESIVLDIDDAEGRCHRIAGTTISWMMRPSPHGIGLIHFVRWDFGGVTGYGELQDIWPQDLWSFYRRSERQA